MQIPALPVIIVIIMSSNITHRRRDIVGKRQFYRRLREAKNNFCTEAFQVQMSNVGVCPQTLSNSDWIVDQSYLSGNVTNLLPLSSDSPGNSLNLDFNDSINLAPLYSQCTEHEHVISPVNNSKRVTNLPTELGQWATQHNIPRIAVSNLLHILSPLHSDLPLDSRTLLKTPIQTKTMPLSNGKYCHFGSLCGLQSCLSKHIKNVVTTDKVQISFNIDGIPLFNSSSIQFWPILGHIVNIKSQPFVIGIFCGSSKPAPLTDFLREFISELSELLNNGFLFNNCKIEINIHSFICDSPARAYIKCVKSHNGYASCDKCEEYGSWYGRVIMEKVSKVKRTDLSFKLKTDKDHHIGDSPLAVETLSIGMVTQFPTDYMHNICLGVMKKLLNTWLGGPLNVRLCSRIVGEISNHMVSLKSDLPAEFNRKPRALSELPRFKATEFRMFLLYLGPLVLKNKIDIAIYENFLLFHFGVSSLISKTYISKFGSSFAQKILTNFVLHCKSLYGVQFLVYNVHMLYHLSEDVDLYGALDNFSAFPFESYLVQLKRLITSPNRPLQQVFRRLSEIKIFMLENSRETNFCDYEHRNGPLPTLHTHVIHKQYKKIHCTNFILAIFSHSSADSYCSTNDGVIIQIHNILLTSKNCIFVLAKQFLTYDSFYSYPIESSLLNIYNVNRLGNELHMWSVNDIVAKYIIFLSAQGSFVAFPLIHTV